MHRTPDSIPTFEPLALAGFIRSQLVAAMTEELEGAFVVQGKLVVPLPVAESWRLGLDGVVAAMKSLREQVAALEAELTRDKRPAKPERCECRETEDGGMELVMDLSGR